MNWMELLIGWSLTVLAILTPISVDAAETGALPQLFDRALSLSRAGDPEQARSGTRFWTWLPTMLRPGATVAMCD